ncbi:UNVERIFIED_CONTAM: hypothetical protein FKN15_023882 [Acipenser sinensis]
MLSPMSSEGVRVTDTVFDGVQGNLAHSLGLSHHIRVLNFAVTFFGMLSPMSSEGVRVTDTVFDGVQVRVFEATRGSDNELKRSVVYIHGGGWSLGSARMQSYDYLCRKMAEDLNAVVVSVDVIQLINYYFTDLLKGRFVKYVTLLQALLHLNAVGSHTAIESVHVLEQHILCKTSVHIPMFNNVSSSTGMQSYDYLCRKMAEDLNAVVVSVDYRLAPEVHFPEQYNDAYLSTKHFLLPEVLAKYSVDPNRVAVSGDSAGGNLAAAVSQQVLAKYSVDPNRVAVSGDSAGGNLAAAVSQQLALDSSVTNKPKLQSLIYPVLQALDFNTPSYQQNRDVPILYRPLMVKFWLEYLNGDPSFIHSLLINNHTSLDLSQVATSREKVNWTSLLPSALKKNYMPVVQATGTPKVIQEVPALLDVRAAPLIADEDVLKLLPQTYVLTCEHDVLRDDGIMYARRLEQAGIRVTHDHYEDGFHGCMIFGIWPTYFSIGIRTMHNYIKWLDQNL